MKEAKYLQGSLEAISLGELLQMVREKTVKINLKNTNESGYIHLHKNVVWDASFKGYSPHVSLNGLIKFKEGDFDCEFDVMPLENKLGKDVDQLLMEGLIMMDNENNFKKRQGYKINDDTREGKKLISVLSGIIFTGAALATVYFTDPYSIVTNTEARLHYYYGKRAAENKEYNKAMGEFNKAIGLNDNYIDAKISLGEMHTQMGLNYESIKNYTMALEEYKKGIIFGNKTAADARFNLENRIKKETKEVLVEKSAKEKTIKKKNYKKKRLIKRVKQ